MGRRWHGPSPVWRTTPGRLLHDPLGMALSVGVLTMVSVSAAAGPLYAEAVSDSAVRLVLASVPEGAAARDAPVVRLNAGVDPDGRQWSDMLRALEEVPGATPPQVALQSISTELHPKILYDPVGPVLTGDGPGSPVRLFGVDDPAARLVVVSRTTGPAQGVWLPEPVAESMGTAAGEEVRVQLSGLPEPPTTTTLVLGTYAVQADGRTPEEPPGQRFWADVSAAGFPADAQKSTLRAHLAIADVPTTTALARRTEDQLLWTAGSRLDVSSPRLDELRRTADAVAALRRELATRSDLAGGPVPLRPALTSGMEVLAADADELSAAAQRGAAVTTRVGLLLAMVLVVAAAAFSMGRRRREVQLAAGVGRRPASAGLLHAAELVPAAAVAGPVGWVAARALVVTAVGSSSPSRPVLTLAALWCAGSMVAALLAAGVVAAVATRLQVRRLEGRPDVQPPWVVVLVTVAVAATVGLLTRSPAAGDRLGPLDLMVPPLVMAALAAVGARLVYAALRRARTRARPPTRRTVVGWLARRRLQSPDRGREAATAIAATGLAMLVFSVSSIASLHETVEDRAAVEVGATTVHRVGPSWLLDPGVAVQADAPDDDSPVDTRDVPVARDPVLPPGQAVVWQTRTTVAASEAGVSLLVIDPARLADAADWGSEGGPVAAGRSLLPALAEADAAAAATTRRDGVSTQVPVLLVGRVGDLDLGVGSTVTVDTMNLPVRLVVRGTLTAFPGTGTNRPTLVVPSDSFFAAQFNEDPRLRPGRDAPRNRPLEFQADLWSDSAPGAAATLARSGLVPDLVGTLAQARATPVYVAAAQARRYQIALGVVFGAVGLAAVVLAAVRLARQSPAADRMLAWSATGRGAPARARLLEVGFVLALSAALSALALAAMRPLAAILLEPGDGRSPPASLVIPVTAAVAAATWLVLTALAALAATALATTSQPTVEVLRGED